MVDRFIGSSVDWRVPLDWLPDWWEWLLSAGVVALLLNWMKEWWQSRTRLRLRASNPTALGEVRVPTPNGDFLRCFYALDLSITNDSTRSYEIDRLEVASKANGLKSAQLKQKAHAPPGTLSPWGKSTDHKLTWIEGEVWPSCRFKVGRRESETRKLIVDAEQASPGAEMGVRAIGTDGKDWKAQDEITLP